MTKITVGTGWVIDLTGIGDGYLGQSTPSLTAGHYRVVILGPIITTTNLDANAAYTHIGTVLSGAGVSEEEIVRIAVISDICSMKSAYGPNSNS